MLAVARPAPISCRAGRSRFLSDRPVSMVLFLEGRSIRAAEFPPHA
jgi:hypothetical protein